MSMRSSSEAADAQSWTRSIAERPASSSIRFPSARVTMYGWPTGRQPCDTTVLHRDAVEEDADRAGRRDAVVEHQPVARRGPAPRRLRRPRPATDRRCR